MNIEKGATLDSDNHRYLLTRTWDRTTPPACFVMLNPSTADHDRDDPTIKTCIKFARCWGYGGIIVVNLFSYRTSHPRKLYTLDHADAVGAFNDRYISEAITKSTLIVVAWGNHGRLKDRDLDVLDLIRAHNAAMCFGVTKSNMPLHPMARGKYRIPDDVQLRRYVEK